MEKNNKKMKAVIRTRYGSPDVLQLMDVEKPIPKDNEVLVKIHTASLNAGDLYQLKGESFIFRLMGGFLKPRQPILGDDIAGHIEAVGRNIKQFQPGDDVFGWTNFGAFAEYRCVPETAIVLKPANVSFEEATTIPIAAMPALFALRDKGKVQSHQKVLINGASGGVGIFTVQLAKLFGAEVTAVCSTRNLEMMRSIGADHVIDYTQEDFTRNDLHYDLIIAVNGYHSISDYMRVLNPKGIYICIGGTSAQYYPAMFLGPFISMMSRKKVGVVLKMPKQEDLTYMIDLIKTRKVIPVIDKVYKLSEVPEALRYLDEEHAQGKVVIKID